LAINDGWVDVTNSLAGPVIVGNAGTLIGFGSVGAVTNNGLTLPGPAGPLTGVDASHLTLHAASYAGPGALTIRFDGPTHTALQVVGNANVTGETLNLSGSRF